MHRFRNFLREERSPQAEERTAVSLPSAPVLVWFCEYSWKRRIHTTIGLTHAKFTNSLDGVESTIKEYNLLNLLSLFSMWKRISPSLISSSKTEWQNYLFCSFSRFHPHPSKEKPKKHTNKKPFRLFCLSSKYPKGG